LANSPNHTRANIRIKFADGHILQGTFGAREKVKDIYDFVKENLSSFVTDRAFELFETPPRRVLGAK
jgi:hypothetical protein